MKIKSTTIIITPSVMPSVYSGSSIRGFVINKEGDDPLMHGHIGDRYVYRHPLVQYKIMDGKFIIKGLGPGAEKLYGLVLPREMVIFNKSVNIDNCQKSMTEEDVGVSIDDKKYEFLTPWIALNSKNLQSYQSIKGHREKLNHFLSKILIGNLLSLSKSFGLWIGERLKCEFVLREIKEVGIKDCNFIGFLGSFTVNFNIPQYWGIGKFSSRGYGMIINKIRR